MKSRSKRRNSIKTNSEVKDKTLDQMHMEIAYLELNFKE